MLQISLNYLISRYYSEYTYTCGEYTRVDLLLHINFLELSCGKFVYAPDFFEFMGGFVIIPQFSECVAILMFTKTKPFLPIKTYRSINNNKTI